MKKFKNILLALALVVVIAPATIMLAACGCTEDTSVLGDWRLTAVRDGEETINIGEEFNDIELTEDYIWLTFEDEELTIKGTMYGTDEVSTTYTKVSNGVYETEETVSEGVTRKTVFTFENGKLIMTTHIKEAEGDEFEVEEGNPVFVFERGEPDDE